MLLLLSQQWMEVLNAGHEIRAISLDISCAFDTVWHPALLTKLSSYGIQGNLHSWLTDFLSCRSQRVTLNGVLSSPLSGQAGVPQGSILGPVLFLVFINDLSDSLENALYLFADDSTLCRTIGHPSDWQAAASSLSADLGKITNWANTWNMSSNPFVSVPHRFVLPTSSCTKKISLHLLKYKTMSHRPNKHRNKMRL